MLKVFGEIALKELVFDFRENGVSFCCRKFRRVHVSDDEKNIVIYIMMNHIVTDGDRA